MARAGLKKQPAIATFTIMENFETEVLGMPTLIKVDILTCASGILSLVVPEQNKGNLKPLLKHVLRQFNSEGVEGSDDGGSSWYTKLNDHLE